MIKYFVKKISLKNVENKYSAQVKTNTSVNINQVIKTMISQGSTVGAADILSVIHEFHTAIVSLLQMGNSITTPLANYKPGINGLFDDPDDRFDRARHKLKVNITPGMMVINALDQVPVEKIEPANQEPGITSFHDNLSKTSETITPGGIGIIKGYRLSLDQNNTDEGIWFHNGASSARVENIATNRPGELVFMNPTNLSKGKYHIEVRNRSKGAKELRTFLFKPELQVK